MKSKSSSLLFQQAFQYYQNGQFAQAEELYRQIVRSEPTHAQAWHLLGVIAYQNHNYPSAVELIKKAIYFDSSQPSFYNNLGNALSEQKQFEEAVLCYQQALTHRPHFAEAYNNLGNALKAQKRWKEAESCYRRALHFSPDYIEAHNGLGIVLSQQKKFIEAATFLQRALSLNPQHLDAYNNLGNVFKAQRQFASALNYFQRALHLNPDYVEVYNNLGQLYAEQGQLEQAKNCYQHALNLRPHFMEAWLGLGNIWSEQGQVEHATHCFKKALEIAPRCFEAQGSLGNLLLERNRFLEAQTCYQTLLTLNPYDAVTYNNLGNALVGTGKIHQALSCYRTALDKDPHYATAHSNLLLAMNYADDLDPKTIFLEHQKFNQQHILPIQTVVRHLNDLHPDRPLKVGYLSQDFRKHSVAYFIEPLLAHHDPQQVQAVGYYAHSQEDEVTHRLQRYTQSWTNCFYLSDEELAEKIRQDRIDILVDLMGHTGKNRILVFARHSAPIQMTYLGYSNTTGLTSIAYRITDRYADPEGLTYSSETLVRMPESYFCYVPADETYALPLPSASHREGIIFGSFNHYSKLSPTLLHLWAQLLLALPQAKLLIKARSLEEHSTQQALRDFFEVQGIEPQRLICSPFIPKMKEHLSVYHQVDIALDSYPYNGATTTCESLWMGIPVVTLVGQTHVSRMGLSILSTVGLNELIAYTSQEYIDICINLAHNPDRLQNLKAGLREKMKHSSLMDAVSFTRHLEGVYRKIWKEWCQKAR